MTATRRHRRLLAYLKARQKGYGSPPRSISRTPFSRPPVGLFCDAYAITNIFRSCRSGRWSSTRLANILTIGEYLFIRATHATGRLHPV